MHTVEASILVKAPVAECYRRWMDFERFPEFMRRVVSVRRANVSEMSAHAAPKNSLHNPQGDYEGVINAEVLGEVAHQGGNVWHWEVRGPLGKTFHWTAGIVHQEENKVVSWASTADQELPTGGSVNFLKQTPGQSEAGKLQKNEQTLVEVKMTFSAPAPPFGELVADITHYGDNVVNEALEDFKSYVEREVTGELNPAKRHDATRETINSEEQLRKQVGTPGAERTMAEQQSGFAHADNELMPKGATTPGNVYPEKQ